MTRRTARVFSLVTMLANVAYVWRVTALMVSERGPQLLTTRGYVFMTCTMIVSTALACLLVWVWHSLIRERHAGKRPTQRRQRWRGNEYQGSKLDYSYLRDDEIARRDAMRRTV